MHFHRTSHSFPNPSYSFCLWHCIPRQTKSTSGVQHSPEQRLNSPKRPFSIAHVFTAGLPISEKIPLPLSLPPVLNPWLFLASSSGLRTPQIRIITHYTCPDDMASQQPVAILRVHSGIDTFNRQPVVFTSHRQKHSYMPHVTLSLFCLQALNNREPPPHVILQHIPKPTDHANDERWTPLHRPQIKLCILSHIFLVSLRSSICYSSNFAAFCVSCS